jgi:bifunctional non-homologous end joining protein LigD
MIEGVVSAEMPRFIEPQLATLKTKVPKGHYLHEIKFDGYRAQVHLNKRRVTIYTRGGHDWTRRFGPIVDAFDIPVERAIFDGEIVVVEDDRPNFSLLQEDLSTGRKDRMGLYLFDLLYLDGFDLREGPLIERKRILAELFEETKLPAPVFYSQHFDVDRDELFASASKMNLEGIISKNANARYRSGRTESWVKLKCVQKGRFPVVGFVPDVGGVAALYLGRQEGNELVYAGKVGSGFSQSMSMSVRRALDKLVTPEQKLTRKVRKPKARWVEPKLYAEVEYRDITSDGLLRQSAFKGLSE